MESEKEIAAQVCKAVAREISPALRRIETRIVRIEESVDRYVPRRPVTEKTKERHREVLCHLGGRCPCCGEVLVVDEKGNALEAEYDHFYSRERRGFAETWLICKACHQALTAGARAVRTAEFRLCHQKAAKFEQRRQEALPFPRQDAAMSYYINSRRDSTI